MKKNVIAVMLSLVLTVGSVGAPVFAAESTTTQEAVEISEEGTTEEEPALEEEDTDEEEPAPGEEDIVEEVPAPEAEDADEGVPAPKEEDIDEEESAPEEETTGEEVSEPDSEEEVSEAGAAESEQDDEASEEQNLQEDAEEKDGSDDEATAASEEEDEEIADAEEPSGDVGEDENIDEEADDEELTQEEGSKAALDGDVIDSGTCGNGVNWTLTEQDSGGYKLTISGSGRMSGDQDFNYPWVSNGSKIKTVVVEYGITSIGGFAFHYCNSIKNITLPDSLTSIEAVAFDGFYGLNEIHLNSLETWLKLSAGGSGLYGNIYLNDSPLTTVDIPDEITEIRENEFRDCSSLESITLPNNLESIGGNAFRGCSSLESITLPNKLTSIGNYAFFECSSLESIKIPDSVTSINICTFYGCDSLQSITLPNKLESIKSCAFQNCTSLTSITIPDSVTSLDDDAFDDYSGEIRVYEGSKAQQTLVNVLGPDDDRIKVFHTWNTGYTVDKQPTYAEDGSKSIHCSVCGVIQEGSEVAIPKLPKPVSLLTVSGISAKTYTGKALTQAVVVKDGSKTLVSGTDYKLSYKNNINPGTATVTITGTGNYTGSVSRSFKISPCSMSDSRIAVSGISAKTYTGKALTQAVVVKDGSKTLVSGTDYKVSYKNNINAGTATVTITGIGNYTGSVNKTFTIRKAANAVTASNLTRSYSAKAQTITLGAKATGGTLAYKSSNTKVTVSTAGKVTLPKKFTGTVKITITAGNSNYNTATKTITIKVPAKTKLSMVTSRSAGKMKITWNQNTAVTGYQIQYGLKSSFSGARKATISKNSTVSRTIKSLNKGKKYYVRIRSFKTVSGKKYYSAWSAKKAVTIKK